MKEGFDYSLPELEMKLTELLEKVNEFSDQYGGDPLEQALATQRVKERMLETGLPVEEFPKHTTFYDAKAAIEATLEQVRLTKKVELFNLKYKDFFGETPTIEALTEYVHDCRWMLPIVVKLYGEGSQEAETIRAMAELEV